jgi:anti-sigma28 factor (negative regulator of flagellin synthesis)
MEISLIGKTKALQPQTAQDPPRVSKDGDGKSSGPRRVDSADISAGHTVQFEDRRLTAAKSSALYDVSLSAFADRIEELRERVGSGDYNVQDGELADALLG